MVRAHAVALGLIVAVAIAAAGGSARAAAPNWNALAEEDTVAISTTNENGSMRKTTVWLTVVDGKAYIRTSHSTRWGKNVERDPDVLLRAGDSEYRLRASFVEDEALRARIVESFREKYGWTDAVANVMRGSHPRIMQLDARD
jgi:hypothetical protein